MNELKSVQVANREVQAPVVSRVAEAQVIQSLRALNVGLEIMAHHVELDVAQRVQALLESLVPAFADCLTCYLPAEADQPIEVGAPAYAMHVLQTVVLAPNREHGRLVAKRRSGFAAEDAAILQSAANGISLLLYSA